MNHREKSIGENRSRRRPRFLVCDPTGDIGDGSQFHEEWIQSPIECLSKAVDLNPDFVVICFSRGSFKERKLLVELAAALKRNDHTKKSRVVALLQSRHRKLLEDLHDVGADFIKYVDDRLTLDNMSEILKILEPNDRLDKQLAIVCPFLHYSEIDSKIELTTCGAYLDRMILGGFRLHEICETENHLYCEYYMNPRLKR